ncbi:MAG: T9SS type A sorting domain-containing protein [Rubricoccaceae bacterium]|nr:T9SS type A sorting domain-containing protein [Rubricoccaceae bacterium]
MRIAFRLATGALLLAFMGLSPVASAQNCGTDAFGYTCTDSDDADNPPAFDFKDISASGIATGLGDDAIVKVGLSFGFTYYGVVYDSLTISSNGWIAAGTAPTFSDLSNDPIPTPGGTDNVIAVLWDDLDPACSTATGDCEVYYEDRGDKFIVQWNEVPHFPDSNEEYNTVQVAITPDGDIRMTYELFTDDADFGNSYTVGIENSDGTIGIQAAFNGNPLDYLRSGFAVCFDYPGSDPGCGKDDPPVCDIKFLQSDIRYDAATRQLCVDVTVQNNGSDSESVTLKLDYNLAGGPPSGTRTLGSGTLPGGAQASRKICLRVPSAAPPGDYNFTLNLCDGAGNNCGAYMETISISAPRVAGGESGELFSVIDAADFTVAAEASAPAAVAPNPFARQTTISYEVAAAADVRLAVYDVLGREVAVLVDGRVEAGTHSAVFDAADLAAGTYVYRLAVGNDVRTGLLTLAR